jgi:hypothetical protein
MNDFDLDSPLIINIDSVEQETLVSRTRFYERVTEEIKCFPNLSLIELDHGEGIDFIWAILVVEHPLGRIKIQQMASSIDGLIFLVIEDLEACYRQLLHDLAPPRNTQERTNSELKS